MNQPRNVLLADLADSINQLTRPRRHTEYVEVTVIEPATNTDTRRRRKAKRGKRRRAHHITLPPLLNDLRAAAVPGATTDTPGATGGFESRPSAELEPLLVLREITQDARQWAHDLHIGATADLPTLLSRLVSAEPDDQQLERLTRQAARWVRRARQATGFDPTPITLGDPCPYCWKRNALVIAGDLKAAKCGRCGVAWDVDTIGLLADMLRTNQDQPTAVAVACWMADCTRRGPHEVHQDVRGRSWLREDRCVGEDGLPTRDTA